MFPLSLTIPGKGEFRKLIGQDKTYNDRPIYNNTEGEIIFYIGESWVLMVQKKIMFFLILDNRWNLCAGCDFKATGSAVKTLSSSLMIPRLTFQEWEGLQSIAGSNQLREILFS